jgi:DNA-binding transcriptional LysR family regulator
MQDITLFELNLFVRACRTRSLREVARQMNLQPAHVSKTLKRLEGRLERRLFKRSVAGIIVTPEGLDLLATAEQILELGERLLPGAHPGSAGVQEEIWSLGSISFLASRLLAPCIGEFAAARKNSRFRVVEFTHNELVAHGLNGAFEMAVHIEPLLWTKNWASLRIGDLRWGLFARTDHPLSRERETVERIRRYPFIVPTDWTLQAGFTVGEDHCPLTWRERKKGHEAATAETATAIVQQCDNLTFVPKVATQALVQDGRLREILVPEWERIEKSIYLSVRSDIVPKPLQKLVAERLGSLLT